MSGEMKFVYFGSSEYSKGVLRYLYDAGYKPSLIVSKPDRPKGRGLKFLPTEVTLFAVDKNIPLIRPESLKDKTVEKKLAIEKADFFLVADYGIIIPTDVLDIPQIHSLCVHPSLLPRYRGPSPIEYTLMKGDAVTGVTIFEINKLVDAGDIIFQKEVKIGPEENYFTLRQRLAEEGAVLLIDTLKNINKREYSLTPQDQKKVTMTYKLKKETGKVNWDFSAGEINNLIRATLGWPSAYTCYKDKRIKILSAYIIDEQNSASPGTIVNVNKKGIGVATSDGVLVIKKVKPEGKGEMDAWAFVCGHRVKEGDEFRD